LRTGITVLRARSVRWGAGRPPSPSVAACSASSLRPILSRCRH